MRATLRVGSQLIGCETGSTGEWKLLSDIFFSRKKRMLHLNVGWLAGWLVVSRLGHASTSHLSFPKKHVSLLFPKKIPLFFSQKKCHKFRLQTGIGGGRPRKTAHVGFAPSLQRPCSHMLTWTGFLSVLVI